MAPALSDQSFTGKSAEPSPRCGGGGGGRSRRPPPTVTIRRATQRGEAARTPSATAVMTQPKDSDATDVEKELEQVIIGIYTINEATTPPANAGISSQHHCEPAGFSATLPGTDRQPEEHHVCRGRMEGHRVGPARLREVRQESCVLREVLSHPRRSQEASPEPGCAPPLLLQEGESTVIFENTQRLSATHDLFYTSVLVNDTVELRGMLDSGSVACSLSSSVLPRMGKSSVVSSDSISQTSVVLVGCGGLRTSPICVCELKMKVLDCNILVPTLIVEGQDDDLILGSNVIKHLNRVLNVTGDFWEKVSLSDKMSGEDESLLRLLTTIDKWKGDEIPDKVGFVKLKHAVTLEPMKEHLVWGRFPSHKCLSAGSTVIVEPND
ncbi:hypothetical protein L3Q82_001262 [Scortum barcoo]|uniref:Uncharacterized protein n=1 Tax=Scortum barcoo TaxID=214431 RepID=A0ACB8W7I2_9TELE|nr:hypothetical protein L3Q82_001262 [Scortum barcoo]